MEKVYQLMRYEYDGCGKSWEDPTSDSLKRTLASAQKAVEEYKDEGFEILEDNFGKVAFQKSGRYAFVRITIEERELED